MRWDELFRKYSHKKARVCTCTAHRSNQRERERDGLGVQSIQFKFKLSQLKFRVPVSQLNSATCLALFYSIQFYSVLFSAHCSHSSGELEVSQTVVIAHYFFSPLLSRSKEDWETPWQTILKYLNQTIVAKFTFVCHSFIYSMEFTEKEQWDIINQVSFSYELFICKLIVNFLI